MSLDIVFQGFIAQVIYSGNIIETSMTVISSMLNI